MGPYNAEETICEAFQQVIVIILRRKKLLILGPI